MPEVFKQLHAAAAPELYKNEMMRASNNIMTASYSREKNSKSIVSQPPVPRPIVTPKDVQVGPKLSDQPLPPLKERPKVNVIEKK